jgi:phosphoribosyl-dephospho-CoA transferase
VLNNLKAIKKRSTLQSIFNKPIAKLQTLSAKEIFTAFEKLLDHEIERSIDYILS